jgi:hypothetical protein
VPIQVTRPGVTPVTIFADSKNAFAAAMSRCSLNITSTSAPEAFSQSRRKLGFPVANPGHPFRAALQTGYRRKQSGDIAPEKDGALSRLA